MLLSSDRTILMNPVCLDVLQDVFIEFSEVKVSAHQPLSVWRRPMSQNVKLTELNKNILQFI